MSQAINNMSVTWTSGATENGIKLDVTDPGAAAASNLLDLQVGGASRFSVRKDGYTTISNLLGTIGLWAGATQGLFVRPDQARLTVGSNGRFSFSANTNAGSTEDTGFNLDAANTLAQRNAGNPQTFRIYNSYTDGSNYDRGYLQWQGNAFQVGTQRAGSFATPRDLLLQTNGTTRLTLAGSDGAATFTGSLTSGPATFNGASSTIASFQDISTGSIFTVNNSAATALLDVTDVTSGDLLQVFNSSGTMVFDVTDAGVANASTSFALGTAADVVLTRDGAANTLAQRNGTAAQIFRLYSTWANTGTDFERFFISAPAGAAVQLGTQKGGTGTARALEFQTDGTTRLTIAAAGGVAIAFQNTLTFTSRGILSPAADGVFTLLNAAGSGFGRLQFGGTGASNPAIKRDATTLQARLADDSAFTNIQGKLTTETAYTAGAPTATGYLVLYDSNGTAYKVPAVAL